MTPETVLTLGNQALSTTVLLATPLLAAALIIGVLVGLFQAATQINEMTLSFVPKLLVLAVVVMLGGSWMLTLITDFTIQLFQSIPSLIG